MSDTPPVPDEPDMVNQAPHYVDLGIEPIDAIDAWGLGYYLGNVVKYVARAKLKGGMLDLKKAQWYLNRYIERKEQGDDVS